MDTWEYAIYKCDIQGNSIRDAKGATLRDQLGQLLTHENREAFFTSLGLQGWEMVSATPVVGGSNAVKLFGLKEPTTAVEYVFKRRKMANELGVPVPVATVLDSSQILTLGPDIMIELVHVPAGEFLMGSEKSIRDNETPQHQVMLDDYLIGKYLVTNAQYAAFLEANNFKWFVPFGKENHPVNGVNWYDATEFCTWAGQVTGRKIQLPTEAQWEKAARGTDGRVYPWGDDWDAGKANTSESNIGSTTPVGKYSPDGDSPYMAADMAGNVFQWTADWYDANYYSNSPFKDPPGPAAGQTRVVRGGSWCYAQVYARSAYRNWNYPPNRIYGCGFRVVAASVS